MSQYGHVLHTVLVTGLQGTVDRALEARLRRASSDPATEV